MAAKPPQCIGHYLEGDLQCDGDPNSAVLIDKIPCAWRDRCVGLGTFCDQMNHKAETVINTLGDGLVQLCETQIEKLQIEGGRINHPDFAPQQQPKPVVEKKAEPPKPTPPKKSEEELFKDAVAKLQKENQQLQERTKTRPSRRKRAKATTTPPPVTKPSQPEPNEMDFAQKLKESMEGNPVKEDVRSGAPERPQNRRERTPSRRPRKKTKRAPRATMPPEVLEIAQHFEMCLRDALPKHSFAKAGRVVVQPGTLYAVNRVKGSRYVRWYCSSKGGRDFAVACLWFKIRSKTVDIAIPADIEQLQKAVGDKAYARLNPKHKVDGQFYTVCRGMDKEGAAKVVQALKKLSKDVLPFLKG